MKENLPGECIVPLRIARKPCTRIYILDKIVWEAREKGHFIYIYFLCFIPDIIYCKYPWPI